MDLKFREGDVINVFLTHGFRVISIRLKIASITTNAYSLYYYCYKLDSQDREISSYYLRIDKDGLCEIGAASNIIDTYWDICYLNKESAILQVEESIVKESDKLKKMRAELLKLRFLGK